MQVVLEVVRHPGAAVAVVHAEEGQVGVALQVREGRAPANKFKLTNVSAHKLAQNILEIPRSELNLEWLAFNLLCGFECRASSFVRKYVGEQNLLNISYSDYFPCLAPVTFHREKT